MRVSEDEKDKGSIALLLNTCAPNTLVQDSRLPTLLGPGHISQVKPSASFPPAPSAHMCFKNTSFSSNIAKQVARRIQKIPRRRWDSSRSPHASLGSRVRQDMGPK